MSPQDLKGLSTQDAIAKAAEYAGVRPSVLDNMWDIESRRGTHPTMIGPETKFGTAKGHFQILDGINDNISKQTGYKLDRFDFSDSLYGAAYLLKQNMSHFGNETDAVAAYNGGWSKANWSNKETQDYVTRATGVALPQQVGNPDPMVKAPKVGKQPKETWDNLFSLNGKTVEQMYAHEYPPQQFVGQSIGMPSLDNADSISAVDKLQAESEKAQQKKNDQSFWGLYDRSTTLGAAYHDSLGFTFEIARNLSGDLDHTPDPAFKDQLSKNWQNMLQGYNEDEQHQLLGARNAQEYADQVHRIGEKRENQIVMGNASGFGQVAAGLIGGSLDPSIWALGFGVGAGFRAYGVGASALAKTGHYGAAMASTIGENVFTNVAWEGLQQAMGEHKSFNDYMGAALTGLVPGVVFGAMTVRSGYHARLKEIQDKSLKDVAADRMDTAARAMKEVGPDASAERLKAAQERIEAEKTQARQDTFTAEPDSRHGLDMPNLDDPETARAYVESENPAEGVQGEQAKPQADAIPKEDPFIADSKAAQERLKKDKEPTPASGEKEVMFSRDKVDQDTLYMARMREGMQRTIYKSMGWDINHQQALDLGPGVHFPKDVTVTPEMTKVAKALDGLRRQFMPESTIMIGKTGLDAGNGGGVTRAYHRSVGREISVIGLDASHPLVLSSASHEFGHMLTFNKLAQVEPRLLKGMLEDYKAWHKEFREGNAQDAALGKSPVTRAADGGKGGAAIKGELDHNKTLDEVFRAVTSGGAYSKYFSNFDEFAAEQFVKHLESIVNGDVKSAIKPPLAIVKFVLDLMQKLKAVWDYATKKGLNKATDNFAEFFESSLAGAKLGQKAAAEVSDALPKPTVEGLILPGETPVPGNAVEGKPPRMPTAHWDAAVKYGLDKRMPRDTPRARAEFALSAKAYADADKYLSQFPVDAEKAKVAGNNDVINVASPGAIMAASENPIIRMLSGMMIENASGASGRRTTAAIMKHGLEQGYVGNGVFEYDRAYTIWRKANGGGFIEDHFKGDVRQRFNHSVAEEIENRRMERELSQDPQIVAAADAMESAFERMRTSQLKARTVGFGRLPETSRGYMPHQLSAERISRLQPHEESAFLSIIEQQFKDLNDWDDEFARGMARRYLDHARQRANGGNEIPANVHDERAADMVKQSLKAMGLTPQEVQAQLDRFSMGGAKHTKKRVVLDLNTEYADGSGGYFKLLDLMDTNVVDLMRSQARRVGGEVALSRYGIMGSQGLKLLRNAVVQGSSNMSKKIARELKALDQVSAEMLGMPFGEGSPQWMDRVMTLNTVARLGGMGVTQMSEAINGIWSLGVGNMLQFVGGTRHLFAETGVLAKGGKVKNGILSSVEKWGGGGEFGMEGYKMISRFDNPENVYASYGKDAATWVDRSLRAGAHALGTLSMHRRIQAMQVRGMAEQIVMKAARYIKEGTNSKALADMGFTPELVSALKPEIDQIAKWHNGDLLEFNLDLASNSKAASAFAYAVNRGAKQIIQGTFVGEQGAWAHTGYLKLMTQFRTFSLTSMEKQWARQRNMHGIAGAMGILIGSMSMSLPIILARVAVSAQGRKDRDEYIARMTSPLALARATLNYAGMSGMAGDLLDALTSVGPDSLKEAMGSPQGGKVQAKSGMANVVPALGYVDDAWAAVQKHDAAKAARLLPFSNVPWLLPAVNALTH